MQLHPELVEIILRDNPHVGESAASKWAHYLSQLSGCHLLSAFSAEDNKAEWLKQRRAGIGGSEIAALLGENKWNSPRQIWLSKVTDVEDTGQSEAARWGNLLETTVAEEWGNRTERQWIHIPVTIQSDDEPWLIANIDGFTLTDDRMTITGILEVKTSSVYNRDAWSTGPLPFNYICQTMWYAGITGLKWVELVCLVGGQQLYYYTLPFDDELYTREKDVAREFWQNNVVKFVEPLATEVDKASIAAMPKDETLTPLIINDDNVSNTVEAYCMIRTKITELKKLQDALSAQINLALKDNTQAIVRDRLVTISFASRQNCNFALLADEYPEAYAKCAAVTTYPVMHIK